jgi:hypothetical protein
MLRQPSAPARSASGSRINILVRGLLPGVIYDMHENHMPPGHCCISKTGFPDLLQIGLVPPGA